MNKDQYVHQIPGISSNLTSELLKHSKPPHISLFLAQGMPNNKLALGLALYGRTFTLADPNNHRLGTPCTGPGKAGTYIRSTGFLAYFEICTMGLTVIEETEVDAPYGYLDDQWVGYDDQTSMLLKVTTLIKGKNLLGAMFWAFDLDDFTGTFCRKGRYISLITNYFLGVILIAFLQFGMESTGKIQKKMAVNCYWRFSMRKSRQN